DFQVTDSFRAIMPKNIRNATRFHDSPDSFPSSERELSGTRESSGQHTAIIPRSPAHGSQRTTILRASHDNTPWSPYRSPPRRSRRILKLANGSVEPLAQAWFAC